MTMLTKTEECGCHTDLSCTSIPPEFVRMRYFFGQRLGVRDFADEQSYHIGKRRLLNRRTHGAGVLCGLRVQRFIFPQGSPEDTPTTILRVIRGLALDACGREIVVGSDQCIDVNAWYLANKDRPEIAEWEGSDEPNKLWVAVRYRECPSDPSPAPRDPCGCDAGGCEFGRVREAFELKLLTESEKADCAHEIFPPLGATLNSLSNVSKTPGTCEDLEEAIHKLVAADCPEPPPDPWLCLACFTVELGEGPQVVNVSDVDNTIPERLSLLSTEALQALVGQMLCNGGAAALAGGPRISSATFAGVENNIVSGEMFLGVALLPDPADTTQTIPLAEATFDPVLFAVHSFDTAAGWTPVNTTVSYDAAADPPRVSLQWDGVLGAGRFRASFDPSETTPVVDERMNALKPTPFGFQFRLEEVDGSLVMAETLFD